MSFITNSLNSIAGVYGNLSDSFGALSLGRKVAMGAAVVNVAGSYKAYNRAQERTPKYKAYAFRRPIIIGMKTLGGTAYWLTSLGLEALTGSKQVARKRSKSKAAASSFDREAMNADMEKIRIGKTPKALTRMYKQGLAVLKKHDAPAKYVKTFKAAMKFAIAEAKNKKQPASSILHSAKAPHSKNKFGATKAKKKTAAPVIPITEEAKKP